MVPPTPARSWNRLEKAAIAVPISLAVAFPLGSRFCSCSQSSEKKPKHAQGADPAHSKPFHPFYTSKTLLHVPPFFVCVSHPAFSAWFCLLEIVLHYERATGEEKKLLLYLALIFPLHSESQKLTFN